RRSSDLVAHGLRPALATGLRGFGELPGPAHRLATPEGVAGHLHLCVRVGAAAAGGGTGTGTAPGQGTARTGCVPLGVLPALAAGWLGGDRDPVAPDLRYGGPRQPGAVVVQRHPTVRPHPDPGLG